MKKNSQRRDEGQLKSSIPVCFANQFVSEAVVYEKAQNSKWFAAPAADSWPPANSPQAVASCGSSQAVCTRTHTHAHAHTHAHTHTRAHTHACARTRAHTRTRAHALPGGARGEEPTCQCGRHKRCRFDPWVGKISWRRACNPLQDSCLENPMDRGAWQVTVHGVTVSSHTHTHTHNASALLCISLPFSLDGSFGECSIFPSDKNQADSPSLRAVVNLSPAASMKWQALCFTLHPSARHKLVECLGQKDVQGHFVKYLSIFFSFFAEMLFFLLRPPKSI